MQLASIGPCDPPWACQSRSSPWAPEETQLRCERETRKIHGQVQDHDDQQIKRNYPFTGQLPLLTITSTGRQGLQVIGGVVVFLWRV